MRGFLGIFTYLFLNLATGPILKKLGVESLTKTQSALISLAVGLVVLAILILLSWKTLKKNWEVYKKKYKELLGRNVKYWVCALFIMMAINVAISVIFGRLRSANDQTIRDLFAMMPIYVIFEVSIIAPITEELVFRQSIRYMVKNKWVFIIASGLIFGFMHTLSSLETVSDFLYIIPYGIPGGFFAYMLYEEDNVLVPMSFHMIHNTLAVILLIVSKIYGIG